jgi:hypothetical protein
MTTESVEVLLVDDPKHKIQITPSEVRQNSLPFLNDWYSHVSYGAFTGFRPAQVGQATKPDGVVCDAGTMLNWAANNFPRSVQEYVVVVPFSACGTIGQAAPGAAFFTDDAFVHTSPPESKAVYFTAMEIGHSLFGQAHANALDCQLAFSWDCYTRASTDLGGTGLPKDLSDNTCAQNDGTARFAGPAICVYGDPWDAMGDDYPGRMVTLVGTIPGDAWPNGIELDKMGWLAGRKTTVGQGVWSLRPLEQQAASGPPQVLWIPAITGTTPPFTLEYRRPTQSPSVSPWLDGFLNGCVTAGFDCGWPEVTGTVLIHAVPNNGQSQSLLIDSTPDSNRTQLCPAGQTGNIHNNAFCDWYDAGLQPGVANSFVPNGPYVAPYYVTVLSAGATGATVAVNVCPCQDPFSPSSGDFGQIEPGTSKSLTFTLTNNAVGVTHTISTPSITGFSPGAYSIDSTNCAALAPMASCQITVSFHPSRSGLILAHLTIIDTNPAFPIETVPLSGSGISTAGWSIVPSPNNGTGDNGLGAVSCVSASSCTAVGAYRNSSGLLQTLVEAWNGTSWSIVPSPNNGTGDNGLGAVSCVSPSSCTGVGIGNGLSQTLVEAWNGTSWSIVPSPNNGGGYNYLSGVSCVSANSCTAVGTYASNFGPQTLVEAWDGTSWSIVPSPNNGTNSWLYGVSCVSASSCTAVGFYLNSASYSQTLVEAWNGSSWSIVPSPNYGPTYGTGHNALYGVSCVSASSCTAVGINGVSQTLVEAWDGTSWSIVPSPNNGIGAHALYGVSCVSASSCAAVGYVNHGSPSPQTMVEAWNGSSWSIVPSANNGTSTNFLNGVSCISATSCVAVGVYINSSGHPQTLVEVS